MGERNADARTAESIVFSPIAGNQFDMMPTTFNLSNALLSLRKRKKLFRDVWKLIALFVFRNRF